MERDRLMVEPSHDDGRKDRPAIRPSGAPEIPDILRNRPREEAENAERSMTSLAKGLALGWDLVGSVAAGLIIGVLLDRWLGTSPAFVLLGLVAGLFGSTWRLVQQSARDAKRADDARESGRARTGASDDRRR
ncbi:MAG: AtpZ/AtpI family protein [Planctomycetota bacterium]